MVDGLPSVLPKCWVITFTDGNGDPFFFRKKSLSASCDQMTGQTEVQSSIYNTTGSGLQLSFSVCPLKCSLSPTIILQRSRPENLSYGNFGIGNIFRKWHLYFLSVQFIFHLARAILMLFEITFTTTSFILFKMNNLSQ